MWKVKEEDKSLANEGSSLLRSNNIEDVTISDYGGLGTSATIGAATSGDDEADDFFSNAKMSGLFMKAAAVGRCCVR